MDIPTLAAAKAYADRIPQWITLDYYDMGIGTDGGLLGLAREAIANGGMVEKTFTSKKFWADANAFAEEFYAKGFNGSEQFNESTPGLRLVSNGGLVFPMTYMYCGGSNATGVYVLQMSGTAVIHESGALIRAECMFSRKGVTSDEGTVYLVTTIIGTS